MYDPTLMRYAAEAEYHDRLAQAEIDARVAPQWMERAVERLRRLLRPGRPDMQRERPVAAAGNEREARPARA
jgi:hypothetical protein